MAIKRQKTSLLRRSFTQRVGRKHEDSEITLERGINDKEIETSLHNDQRWSHKANHLGTSDKSQPGN